MARDAIVIGAGLSGLVCARRLVAAGLDVTVLEARRRIGGRLYSGRVGGAIIDLGGQWMSVDQPRLLALAGELGVASAPQPRAGRAVFDDRGRHDGLFARLATLIAQLGAVRRIGKKMRQIPPGDPAAAGGAAELDAVALGPWLAGTIPNAVARARIAMHAELVFAVDPAGLSLLAYLARLGVTGGFSPRGPELPGGGRDHRFVRGAQALTFRLADHLPGRIQIATPVTAVVERGARFAVVGPDGEQRARHVVLAVPPGLAAAIETPLAPATVGLARAMLRGGVVKCFCAYDTAFWRAAGLSGEAYQPRGTLRAVVDGSPPGGGAGVLQAFVVGDEAARWHTRDPEERRGEVIASLVGLFGEAAAAPLDYVEVDWAIDPWSAGCVASTPPGVLTAGARWETPATGRFHVAGTESAVRWPGYMEGAIEAGERAARAVLADGRPASEPV